jgi:hypothetical protein
MKAAAPLPLHSVEAGKLQQFVYEKSPNYS